MPRDFKHRLSDIDEANRTATCAECGPVTIRRKNTSTGWRCNRATHLRRHPHRAAKGKSCERCGFEAEHPCQLDVHHKDGDRANNDPSNLETLCANCHRLVHAQREAPPE